MTPKKMKRLLIITITLLVIVSAAGIFFANKKLTTMAKETVRLSADIEITKKQIEIYAATKTRVESLGYVGDLADKVLPTSQEQSVVVAELSTFASRAGLAVNGIEFIEQAKSAKNSKDKASAVPKGVGVVPVIIKFADVPYENLLEFMQTIEQNQRKMQVTSINLTPNEEQRSVLSEVAVTLNLYVKKAVEKK